MSLIYFNGMEDGGLGLFVSYGDAAIASSSGLDLDGDYCLNLTNKNGWALLNVTADDEYYFQFLYRHTNNTTLGILATANSGTPGWLLKLVRNSSGLLEAQRGTTLIATGPTNIMINTTYKIDIYMKIADSGGRFVVKLNGITEIDFTGDTKPATDTEMDLIYLGFQAGTAYYGYSYFDNIIIKDDGYIGNYKIQKKQVNAQGSNYAWDPSNPLNDNYEEVDEIPPSSSDYVYTNTNDVIDTHATTALTGSIANIIGVMVQALGMQIGNPTPTQTQLVVRSGGTEYFSSNKILPNTSPDVIFNIWETDPDTSLAWTESGVNSAEIGVKAIA